MNPLSHIWNIPKIIEAGFHNAFNAKYKETAKRSKADTGSIFEWALSFYETANKLVTWALEFGVAEKMIDLLVTYTTSDDFFEPVSA